MNVTAEGIRALRELTGMGMTDLERATLLARDLYDGDVLLGVGHRVVSAYAVCRKGTPGQVAASLARSAAAWAEPLRALPEWQEALALFAAPPSPGCATQETPAAPVP